MIRTVADLLAELMEIGASEIDATGIVHRTTIGNMYEALSQRVLGLAMPEGADVRLVSGFATDGTDRLSGQIDCMLVRGAGRQLPFSRDVVWHVRDVIAVFEVKKTLTKPILADAFAHLADFAELERRYWQSTEGENQPVDPTPIARTFAQITRQMPNLADVDNMAIDHQMIFHALVCEYEGAVRVVLGHNGWATEDGFRGALSDILTTHVGETGYGVVSFPQLIVAGAHALIKANGQPYTVPLVGDGWWPFYLSSSINPLVFVLEFIWTRLEILLGGQFPWGDDLEVDELHPFLAAKPGWTSEQIGWNYQFSATARPFTDGETDAIWAPSVLTEEQFVVLQRLAAGQRIHFDDPVLLKFLGEQEVEAEGFWEALLATSLVARSADGEELVLITRDCVLAIDPVLGYVAAENGTGQLFRWLKRDRPSDDSSSVDPNEAAE
jgi:hypothetical protein